MEMESSKKNIIWIVVVFVFVLLLVQFVIIYYLKLDFGNDLEVDVDNSNIDNNNLKQPKVKGYNCSVLNPVLKDKGYADIAYMKVCNRDFGYFELDGIEKSKDGRMCCARNFTSEELVELEVRSQLEWDCSLDNVKLKNYQNVSYRLSCDGDFVEIEGFIKPKGFTCCGILVS